MTRRYFRFPSLQIRSTAQEQPSAPELKNEFFLADIAHTIKVVERRPACLLISGPILVDESEKTQIVKVEFNVEGHDQGWCTEDDFEGAFEGSWTWFEVAILCPDPEKKSEEKDKKSEEKDKRRLTRLSFERCIEDYANSKIEQAQARGLHLVVNPGSDEKTGSPFWHLQRNLRGNEISQSYNIIWERDSSPSDTERIGWSFDAATGSGSGVMFVNSLRKGDRIAIVARAKYPYWVNYVSQAELKVFFVPPKPNPGDGSKDTQDSVHSTSQPRSVSQHLGPTDAAPKGSDSATGRSNSEDAASQEAARLNSTSAAHGDPGIEVTPNAATTPSGINNDTSVHNIPSPSVRQPTPPSDDNAPVAHTGSKSSMPAPVQASTFAQAPTNIGIPTQTSIAQASTKDTTARSTPLIATPAIEGWGPIVASPASIAEAPGETEVKVTHSTSRSDASSGTLGTGPNPVIGKVQRAPAEARLLSDEAVGQELKSVQEPLKPVEPKLSSRTTQEGDKQGGSGIPKADAGEASTELTIEGAVVKPQPKTAPESTSSARGDGTSGPESSTPQKGPIGEGSPEQGDSQNRAIEKNTTGAQQLDTTHSAKSHSSQATVIEQYPKSHSSGETPALPETIDRDAPTPREVGKEENPPTLTSTQTQPAIRFGDLGSENERGGKMSRGRGRGLGFKVPALFRRPTFATRRVSNGQVDAAESASTAPNATGTSQ